MRAPVVLWLVGWLLFAIPWMSFTSEPQWGRVMLLPFRYAPRLDDVLNFLYCLPIGALAASWRWSLPRVTIAAGLLSALTELIQVFSTTRYPSTRDVLLNVSGAVLGFVLWSRQSAACGTKGSVTRSED